MRPDERLPLVFDMETGDPDDFLTLLLLLQHPRVDLRAVTITPGTPEQVGLVRWALSTLGADIPVGAHRIGAPSAKRAARPEDAPGESAPPSSVSGWHYRAFGKIPPSLDAVPAGPLLARVCDESVTLLTGGPLKNLGAAMQEPHFRVGRLVAQGGFAGAGVVPPEDQLDKFKGRRTCPTYNLNGDPKSALRALSYPGIGSRWFVSKNVCHGVVYDASMHQQLGAIKDKSRSLGLIWHGMNEYLRRNPSGKAFHDPLAACCAIDPSIARWAEVELFREAGEWGSRLMPNTQTHIIVAYDHPRFLSILFDS